MRSGLEHNKAYNLDLTSARLGVERIILTADYTIPAEAPFAHFIDAGAANRTITLPAFQRGRAHIICNVGAANSLTVKDTNANTIATISNVEGAMFVCSGSEWKYLSKTVGEALDPTEITSDDLSLTVTVVGGTVVNLVVNEGAVDHDALLNFVADEHIAHSGITFSAGDGLTGGGTLAANRTFSLNITGLSAAAAPVLADEIAFYDVSGTAHGKATLTTVNGILDHDALLGFVANEHIDHTGVSIAGGAGLTGGGTIAANRTISLDINGQAAAAAVAADEIIYWDVDGLDFNKRTFSSLITDLSILTTAAIGASVQAFDADLSALAALAGTNTIYYRSAADTWTAVTIGNALAFAAGTLSVDAATDAADGVVELATAAETTTGTDATRAVTPDGLAGSDYGKSVVSILVFTDATDCAVGDGAGDVFWRVPAILNGYNLVAVAAHAQTAGVTGTMDIQIHNVTQAADMLTTKITIDSNEKDSSTAATAAVIDAANDDVATGDEIRIDVDVVQTTKAKGLVVELTFQLP